MDRRTIALIGCAAVALGSAAISLYALSTGHQVPTEVVVLGANAGAALVTVATRPNGNGQAKPDRQE